MKETEITKLISFVKSSGKRLYAKQGKERDIGIRKKYLTKEDLRIERELKELVSDFEGEQSFYSEEENDEFIFGKSVWIADPISGTRFFIEGEKNYAIVIAHLRNGSVDFGLVYNPKDDNLYHADNSGAYLNGELLKLSSSPGGKRIKFAPSSGWKDLNIRNELRSKLAERYELFPREGSMAYDYCSVASGRFDGLVSLTKDAFSEFAGCYIVNKAGLKATNIEGNTDISPKDRVFVCGTSINYDDLFHITKSVVE
jgi:myo-inositol-1(or 4)-monophosphatase